MAWSSLTLPKRPLHDLIPVPAIAPNVPVIALPSWRRLPWDSKLPMREYPKGEVPLSRGNICSGTYKSYPHHMYTLSDQHNYEDPGTQLYHPLFDHNLQHYFLHESIFRILLKRHLVTSDGQPVCGLGEYNKYRHYLYNLWSLEVDRLEKRQIEEESNLLEALHQDALGKPYTSIPAARRRWLEYQNELKKEYKTYYHDISQWLQGVSRCYRNAIMLRVARHDAKEAKLRQKWESQREHDLEFFEEEYRIRTNEEIDERRRKERRMREFQKQWDAHDRQLANRKAKLRDKVQHQCDEAAEVVRKFRAKYAKELDDYEEREGITVRISEEMDELSYYEEGEGMTTTVNEEEDELSDYEEQEGITTAVNEEADE